MKACNAVFIKSRQKSAMTYGRTRQRDLPITSSRRSCARAMVVEKSRSFAIESMMR